jgi:hypothetical protein
MDHIRCATLLVIGAICVPAGAQGVRMFFDVSGNAGSDAVPHPGSETLSYSNPVLPAGGGRLYIYVEFLYESLTVLAPDLDITVDGGSITEAWNYNGPGQQRISNDQRWNAATPNPAMNPGANTVSFTAGNLTHMGLGNSPLHDLTDVQHDNARNFGDTLLGYVDVEGDPGAAVWMTVGEAGFAYLHTDPYIYFGFGDDRVQIWDVGVRTGLPEATIIPEPGTAALLLLGGPLIARRR